MPSGVVHAIRILGPGERVSTSHAFVAGRAVLELRTRGLPGEPRPLVTVTVGAEVLGPLRIRSAEYAPGAESCCYMIARTCGP